MRFSTIMNGRNSNIGLTLVGFFLFFTIVASQYNATNCPGPIKFYEELACKPIQGNNNHSGCPVRYDCDHWKNLADNECMINNNKYQEGESIKDEDQNGCEWCTCKGIEGWMCVPICCAFPIRHNFVGEDGEVVICYNKNSPSQCCPSRGVCLEKGEKRPICLVDGKTYEDGEFFIPSAEPEKHCYCGEGYIGENVAPFCALPKHTWCDNIIHQSDLIRQGCIPVYRIDQSPEKDCNQNFRCPNNNDDVIKGTAPSIFKKSELDNNEMLCKFGNLTMQIGDELKPDTDSSSMCMKCVCEVPPVPTCKLRSSAECNSSKHESS